METPDKEILVPYAGVIVKLLRGTLFQEDKKYWNLLLANQSAVRTYFEQIGVSLHLSEADGYAFLTQAALEQDEERLPRLIKRIPLSYEVTLLLVILRESIEEFDNRSMYSSTCFISDAQIKEKIALMFREKTDTVKLFNRFDSYINQAVTLGFLKELNLPEGKGQDRQFEIRRVIRSKINNEKLEEIKEKLASHDDSV